MKTELFLHINFNKLSCNNYLELQNDIVCITTNGSGVSQDKASPSSNLLLGENMLPDNTEARAK